MDPQFTFKSKIWLWSGDKAAWHFATVPLEISKQLKGFSMPRKGFGSIPVNVTIGKTTWKTSIFPEKKGTYILPLKKDVRKAEKIIVDNEVEITIKLQ